MTRWRNPILFFLFITPLGSRAAEPETARLVNIATRAAVGGAAGVPIPGFVIAGNGTKSVVVRAVGPTLGVFGVNGVLTDPRLSVVSGSTTVATNDNWLPADAAAMTSAGAFSLPPGSKDAALVASLGAGDYTAPVTATDGGSGVALVEIYDGALNSGASIVNASTRAFVGTGDSVLIPGFVVSGTGTIRLLVRAVGPTLAGFGVTGTLADPTITLYRGATVLATNDNWSSATNAAEITATAATVGAFPLPTGSNDAALVVVLPAGSYSAVVSGVGATTGTALVELYVAPAAPVAAPNFLFILSDDQSWNGHSVAMIAGQANSRNAAFRTPNLEKLASQGVTFSQAYAGHPTCECSRASLLMGRTTTSLNAPTKASRNWSAPLFESSANTLKRANPAYRAAHLGKWQWFQTPASMGFDVNDGITVNETGDSTDPNDPKLSFSLTRRANAYMEQRVQAGQPFFLQMSYYAVHPIAQALPGTLAKYSGGQVLQAAMTEDFDTCVGELMKKLEELGIANNTYVIFMSDNGGNTQNALRGSKGDCGEGGVRVPLIVRGPGIRGGVYSNEPVIGYDLLPTMLDLAAPGFVVASGVEGGSWRTILQNGGVGTVRRSIGRFVWHAPIEPALRPHSAIRKGDFKLIYYWDTRTTELFNLAQDPAETRNLASGSAAQVDALRAELQSHIRAGIGDAAYAQLEALAKP
ncbi:MAG: sulfatase-like hydrolase/transferase [Opitutaceae bacterium]